MCDFIDPNIHIWSSVGKGGGELTFRSLVVKKFS